MRVRRRSVRMRRDQERARRVADQEPDDVAYGLEFDSKIAAIVQHQCANCDRRYPDLKLTNSYCTSCIKDPVKFTSANNMNIGDIPSALKELTLVEEILIARIHPLISVYKIRGQQHAYSGNVINFQQDVNSIARVLPHDLTDINTLLLVNRQTPHGLQIFKINAMRIRRALLWLKEHHQFYRDIEISEDRIRNLPDDGDAIQMLNDLGFHDAEDVAIGDELEALGIPSRLDHHFAMSSAPINQRAAIINRLESIQADYPQIRQDPINEFNTEGYMTMAFPCLFPYGRGDLRDPTRPKEIGHDKYFKYLLQFKDQRFSKHTRFPFFAMNSKARWDAMNIGSVYLRRNPAINNMSMDELIHQIETNPSFSDNIMYFSSSLRGTRPYWRSRCAELLEMVAQVGNPTIFFTLSAADYHWPDLFRLLLPDHNPEDLTSARRFELMHENPQLTAYFFQKRAEIFITQIMKPAFKVRDHWYRFEWQWRGSPHVHGLLWLEDAPSITEIQQLSEQQINEAVDYFDNLCSAMNEDFNARSPINPCRKRFSEVVQAGPDSLNTDCNELLNNCQRHTQCTRTCLRIRRGTRREECRFKFPQPRRAESGIENINGSYEFFPQRNDERMQRHNRFISQVWRANTDFSPIVSQEAVLNYIAKYASKAEKCSESYQNIARKIIEARDENSRPRSIVKQIILKSVSERDYSAQEVAHIIMSWPLAHSSRSIVTLPIRDEWRAIDNLRSENTHIANYKSREPELEDLSLFSYIQKYRRERGRTILRQTECVVRVVPKLRLRDDSDNEDYYKYQCKLHIPWRTDVNDLKAADLGWEEFYLTHNLINHDLDVPNIEHIYENDEPTNPDDIRELDVYMAAARIGPHPRANEVLGQREMDQYAGWNDADWGFYDKDFVINFKRDLSNHYRTNRLQDLNPQASDIHFSPEQSLALQLCHNQLTVERYATKRVVVQGKAGTGKSAIINRMCHMIAQALPNSYQVLAPTGAAAINVEGKTIHNFLRIPCGEFFELSGRSLLEMQERFKTIKFLIFDEYSMIGSRMLHKINLRCMEAKNNNYEPFGGLFVWFFGDLRQLPPVKDTPIYTPATNPDANFGQLAFQSTQAHIILRTSFRQGPQQQQFRDTLDQIAMGNLTLANFNYLISRRQALTRDEDETFRDAVRLFPTNELVNTYNRERLATNGQPVAEIRAEHRNHTSETGTDEQAQGLQQVLYLSQGTRVMLRKNLQVEAGLVNGSIGIVKEIVYDTGRRPPALPFTILVQFDSYTGPLGRDKVVPIRPITVTWNERGVDCARTQYPLTVAYALTIHKSQGLTLDRAVVDVGDKETVAGLSYVALSRVRSLEHLQLLHGHNWNRFTRIAQMTKVIQREWYLQHKFSGSM